MCEGAVQRQKRDPRAGTASVCVKNKFWALGAAAGSVLVRDGAVVGL